MPMHSKDKILRHGANTAVTCMAAMPFPMAAMPPGDGEDALPYGLPFLMQSISRNPNWLKDWRREDAQPPPPPYAAIPPPPPIVIAFLLSANDATKRRQ